MGIWEDHVLPYLVEKACRSHAILQERERIVPRATGDVLEIGVGSGLNLAFYDAERARSVVGIDPSRPLLERARRRADEARVRVSLIEASAERLPFADARFDSAVLTYTLCSVADPARALAEIKRVLRPGSRLFFVEHGLAPDDGPRAWQRRLTPYWRKVSGNCHLDRDASRDLVRAGFVVDELATRYDEGPRWLSFT